MLQSIRNRMSGGFLALLVLGLITLSFLFFGVATPNMSGVNYAAKVNGVEIPLNSYRQQIQLAENRAAQAYPDGIPDDQRAELRKYILDGLIRNELISQRIYDDRYRISDEELLNQIKTIPQFQLNGQFNRDAYEQYLRINGQSPGQFEAQLKRDLNVNQLRNALAGSSFAIPQEVSVKRSLQNETRKASYAIIPVSQFKNEVNVTDADIAAEYELQKAGLLTEQQVDIEYIELTTADLAKDVEVNDEILAEHYETVSFRFGSPEERKVSHIQVSTDGSDLEERKAFAQGLLDQLTSGADFGELAKANSDDFGSAANNGVLGYFGTNADLQPEFKKTMLELELNTPSELVKTKDGFHIILVSEIKESDSPAFAELDEAQKKSLEEEYRTSQVEGYLNERANEVANEVFDARDSLQEVATKNGLVVKTQKNITKTSFAGLAQFPEVKTIMFSEKLRDGTNSDLIAASLDQAIFLRVTDFRDVTQKTLEEVKANLRQSLEVKAAAKMALSKGTALQAEINSIAELKAAAEASSYSFAPEASLARYQGGVPREILSSVFSANKPAGSAVEQGVEMDNGDYAIFYLTEVTKGDSSILSATEKEAASRTLSSQNGDYEMNAFLDSMREKANIEIAPEQDELNN